MKKILAMFILVPATVLAEHKPEFQSVIDEPANMLDIAMLRLNDFIAWTTPNMAGEYRIAAKLDEPRYMDINASYLAEEGVIHISASLMDLEASREQMEAGCRRVLTMLRINVTKGLHRLFAHVDGSFQPSVNGRPANRSGMVTLSCHVAGQSSHERRFGGAMSLAHDAEMEILAAD
ncbi:MAG: hypothetical protein AAGE85_03390 [Pseudomonadota bacterium]